MASASVEKPQANKRVKKKKRPRRLSVLRSSPPRRGSRGGSADGSDDDWELTSTADLRSPPRRAPTIPNLGVSPPPPSDTPNRMRQRRRSAQNLLRCRNTGCPEANLTFSTLMNRRRHEEKRCLTLIPVCLNIR